MQGSIFCLAVLCVPQASRSACTNQQLVQNVSTGPGSACLALPARGGRPRRSTWHLLARDKSCCHAWKCAESHLTLLSFGSGWGGQVVRHADVLGFQQIRPDVAAAPWKCQKVDPRSAGVSYGGGLGLAPCLERDQDRILLPALVFKSQSV